ARALRPGQRRTSSHLSFQVHDLIVAATTEMAAATVVVRADESKSKLLRTAWKGAEGSVEAPLARHDAAHGREGDRTVLAAVDRPGEISGAVRPDGDSVSRLNGVDRVREGPDHRVRSDVSVEPIRRLDSEGSIGVAQMQTKQVVELGVVSRVLVLSEPPEP